jgi:biofilm PGA synthesis N-glycosyltransferase PgaC
MKLIFWSSFGLIFFAYAGYPICVFVRAWLRPLPVRRRAIFPTVTVVLSVHNEEKHLPGKLANLEALEYPPDRFEVIVVSDGSTDGTTAILSAWQRPARRALLVAEHRGKANAINLGIDAAGGEIICFVDARQTIAAGALKNLISNFADSSVGCASGALVLRRAPGNTTSHGLDLYWSLEKRIRNTEGLAGSTVGVTGAFYAARKNLLPRVPEGTILDDVFIPLHITRQGRRVIFDSTAVAWDDFTPSLRQEFHRKVRTLAGNYQMLQLAPWALTHVNPVRLQFLCHKLLRLLVPFALTGALVSTMCLHQGVYAMALAFPFALYGIVGATLLRRNARWLPRLVNIFLTFLVLNVAALVALIYFVTGRRIAWAR